MSGREHGTELADGQRVGRFLVLRDVDGRRHALAASAISAICETDDGSVLMLPGGRMVHLPTSMADVLAMLDGR